MDPEGKGDTEKKPLRWNVCEVKETKGKRSIDLSVLAKSSTKSPVALGISLSTEGTATRTLTHGTEHVLLPRLCGEPKAAVIVRYCAM